MIQKNRSNFTFRVIKSGKSIGRCRTHSKRRFYNRIRSINWQNKPLRVYLRIYYGKHLSNLMRIEPFWNDGYYENKKDLMLALSAFMKEC